MVVMDDADVDLAVEGALFGGFGTAGRRSTSLGTAIVHESSTTSSSPSSPSGWSRRRSAIRSTRCCTADVDERFAERFEDWLGLVQDHQAVTARRREGGSRRSACGLRGRPEAGHPLPPEARLGVTADDVLYSMKTFGRIVGAAKPSLIDEAMEAGERPWLRALGLILSTRSGEARLLLPRSGSWAAWWLVKTPIFCAEGVLALWAATGKSCNGSRQSGTGVDDESTRWKLDETGTTRASSRRPRWTSWSCPRTWTSGSSATAGTSPTRRRGRSSPRRRCSRGPRRPSSCRSRCSRPSRS